jgi:hypothetical protein
VRRGNNIYNSTNEKDEGINWVGCRVVVEGSVSYEYAYTQMSLQMLK